MARQVLAVGLDQVLRLLHPFVPFITEALWEHLDERAPVRGISEPLPLSDLLITAAWPDPAPKWEDAFLESQVASMQEVTKVIRELRSEHKVPPSRKLQAFIKADGDPRETLRLFGHHIQTLANLDRIEVDPELTRPKLAAAQVVGEAEVYLDGVIDLAQERARLEKQKENVERQLQASESKLANESFIARAPEQVVAAERSKVADLQAQLSRLDATLSAL